MPRSVTMFLFSITLLSFSLPITVMGSSLWQYPPKEIIAAASEGLSSFLQAIPPQELTHFNFNSVLDFEKATIGMPFQIHTISPQNILDYDGSTSVADLIQPTGIWFVPILVNGTTRTLLTVDKDEKGWRAVAIGSSSLAKEWEIMNTGHLSEKGNRIIFVRVYQATSDFVMLDHVRHKDTIIPLSSASVVLGIPKGEARASRDVIKYLQEAVRISIESDRLHKNY